MCIYGDFICCVNVPPLTHSPCTLNRPQCLLFWPRQALYWHPNPSSLINISNSANTFLRWGSGHCQWTSWDSTKSNGYSVTSQRTSQQLDGKVSSVTDVTLHTNKIKWFNKHRLRHGPLVDVEFLVDILPQLIVDFLPPMEILQTVVNEFVSPHQSRPELAAVVMAEVSALILRVSVYLYSWISILYRFSVCCWPRINNQPWLSGCFCV